MPMYHTLGEIPPKRHTTFEKPTGGLYQEELFGTLGFSGMSSLLYHLNPPTIVTQPVETYDVTPKIAVERNMKALSFQGFSLPKVDDFLESRKTLFVNQSLHIGLAAPRTFSADYFYKNGDADEMLFVHRGKGVLKTMYGNIPFGYGDYLIIPRGTTYQIEFETTDNRLLYIESADPIYTPSRYRNNFGTIAGALSILRTRFQEAAGFADLRCERSVQNQDQKAE